MPAFLLSHGLSVERIGLVLAAGIVVRIASGPAIGRLADRLGRRKQTLTVAAALSGFVGWAYTIAFGFVPLLGVSMAHAAATASLAPLSDALSVAAASRRVEAFNMDGSEARARRPSWSEPCCRANSSIVSG